MDGVVQLEMAYRLKTKVSREGVEMGVVQLEMAYRLKTKVSSGGSSSIGNGLPTEDKG